ncbi:MAG: radical SAM protein, partial [Zetaproteobacteria bacterium]|nr:radical SAM protein [Zetaproteobacteria bacterium]
MTTRPGISTIQTKVEHKQPISTAEAKWLFEQATDLQLQQLAQLRKEQHHPAKSATYLIMGIINYTNICVAGCDYCSFYKYPHQDGTYLLSFAQLRERVDKLQNLGASMIAFNGGFHPQLDIYHYAKLFRQVHQSYPELQFYDMTIAEFMFACKRAQVSYPQGAQLLKDAGVEWIPGGGAEILAESFRTRHSPGKYTVEDYTQAQREVLDSGLHSTATMVIGFDETLEERLIHLEQLRDFQDQQTSKLASFLCWTYKPYHNQLGGQELSSNSYLRWLAICRIYLHNFQHIRTSVLTKNEDALQGLLYGANDFDLPLEDEVTEKAGATISHDLEALLNTARQLGYQPIHRDPFKAQPPASPRP